MSDLAYIERQLNEIALMIGRDSDLAGTIRRDRLFVVIEGACAAIRSERWLSEAWEAATEDGGSALADWLLARCERPDVTGQARSLMVAAALEIRQSGAGWRFMGLE